MQRKALLLGSLALLASSTTSRAAADIAFGITSSTAFSLPHYIATEKSTTIPKIWRWTRSSPALR